MTRKTVKKHSFDRKKSKISPVIGDMVKRAAVISSFNKPPNAKDKQIASIKDKLVNELDSLDLSISFTEDLIDAGHPAPAQWVIDVLQQELTTGAGTWRKQIHVFTTSWLIYLSNIPREEINTEEIRLNLTKLENDPFKWLGYVTKNLVPFVMGNYLFMTEQQKIDYKEIETSVFEMTPDGPKAVPITAEDVAALNIATN